MFSLLTQITQYSRLHLIGVPVPTPTNKNNDDDGSDSDTSADTKHTTPFDLPLAQHLQDNDIVGMTYRDVNDKFAPRPSNTDEIRAMLHRRRPSLTVETVTCQVHLLYKRAERLAEGRREIIRSVVPRFEDPAADWAQFRAERVVCDNLEHLTDGKIVAACPDYYYGAEPERLDKRVMKDLEYHLVPNRLSRDHPIAPNFFVTALGKQKSWFYLGVSQATYEGALGARGIHSLQTYGQQQQAPGTPRVFDNKAYTLMWIYDVGVLYAFTCHPRAPAVGNCGDRGVGYTATIIEFWNLMESREKYVEGVTAFRNGLEWARVQRDDAIKMANAAEKARRDARNARNAANGGE